MKFSLLATVIWAAGFVLNAALLLVLLCKRRYRAVPWFSGWIGFGCLYTITLFIAYRIGSKHLYAVLYWSGAFIDLLFQVAVVLEIARNVLQRSGRWVEGARLRLILMGAIAPVVGLGMAWFMTQPRRQGSKPWKPEEAYSLRFSFVSPETNSRLHRYCDLEAEFGRLLLK